MFLFRAIKVEKLINTVYCKYNYSKVITANMEFPESFKFGSSTSAFQIEGACDVDGRGESNFDHILQKNIGRIKDQSHPDLGPRSYNFYKDDVRILKETKVNFYRFSVAWSRILPISNSTAINPKGIIYYNNLINELIANGIEPIITMFHYDLPMWLQVRGGFTSPTFVEEFKNYATILFENYGDRVKRWVTFNQPSEICTDSYGKNAQMALSDGCNTIGHEYLAARNLMVAHASVYHLYHADFNPTRTGKIGISLNSLFYYPKGAEDEALAERLLQFKFGWFAHPILIGGYPKAMTDRVDPARLHAFEDENFVKGTADFIGVNYYTSRFVKNAEKIDEKNVDWCDGDVGAVESSHDPNWPRGASVWLYSIPNGLRDLLKWINFNYNNPEVVITENGWSDQGELEDEGRVQFLKGHLEAVLAAMHQDNCNITGYTAWSIIDNWEWFSGFTERFGLYKINFDTETETRERIPKKSAKYYRSVIETRKT